MAACATSPTTRNEERRRNPAPCGRLPIGESQRANKKSPCTATGSRTANLGTTKKEAAAPRLAAGSAQRSRKAQSKMRTKRKNLLL
jgi:hypothetical protein